MPNTNGQGADGRRGPSIRRPLYLLVAVPLLTVIGLYGFVLYTTVGDAINLDRAPALINATSVPAAQFNINIQNERKASMVYLAAPTAANRAQLQAAQNTTTAAFPAFQAKMNGSATTNAATTAELSAIRQMLSSIQGLAKIRPAILAHAISPTDVFGAYSNVLSQELQLFIKENASLTNASAATSSLAIIDSTESGEFMSQEDALVSASLAARLLPHATRIQVTQLAGARQAMLQAATSRLGPSDLAVFNAQLNKYAPASVQSGLTQLENAVAADSTTFPPFTAASWDPVLKAMSAGIFSAGTAAVENQVQHDHTITSAAWRRVALSGGLGLLGLILSVLLSILIARRIVRRLDRLQGSVETLANEELPDVVARLRRGEDVPVEQLDSTTSDLGRDEIGRVGRAFDAARRTAVEAAVGEARMRRGINDVFRNLARRNQSLLHRELTVLDGMERRTTDPETLEDLFRLDHLTTRMRRHSEGLIILSGAAPGRGWVHPVRMIDVLRAAAAEVEDYSRVTVTTPSQAALAGPAVADVIHLLAELIENATTLSPPYTPVRVSGDMVASGFAVEIEDRGLGMSEMRYGDLNHRLAEPPEFDVFNSEQLGLFVVGQLAKRHGIKVTLRPSPYGGTSAIALIPTSLVGTDDGFVEALPAGASAAASAWPAQELPTQEVPQLTGGPVWGALPQGNGNATAAPNGTNGFSPANGSNGAGTVSEPSAPADPFESYTGPSFGTDPYAAAGSGNAGPPAFGFMTPPAERSSFDSPSQASYGTASDGPSETGLPWPYDRPAPVGTPSFTPNEPPSFTPGEPPADETATGSPFPPAPFPGAEPADRPPYPAGESPYPAADAPLPQRSDSQPSLPLRRRTEGHSHRASGPQFAAEPPTFTPEPSVFAPEPPSLAAEPSQSSAEPSQFGAEPSQFGAEPSQFGAEPSQFGAEQPQFGAEPPSFTPEPSAFAAEPPQFGAEPPQFTPERSPFGQDGPDQAARPDSDVDESYRGLPRRVRQANLVPQLRDAPAAPAGPAAASGDNVANRSPDDIRKALSAMQRGWQQGREVRDADHGFEDHPGIGSVASGHLPPDGEAENIRNGDEGSRGGDDDS
jgi:Nitrate and nitrite sensing/HAMP domain